MIKLEAKLCLALLIITLMSSVVHSRCYGPGEWCYEGGSNKCCPDGYNEKIPPNQRPTYRCVHMHYRHGYPMDIITCRTFNLRKFIHNRSFNSSNHFQTDYAPLTNTVESLDEPARYESGDRSFPYSSRTSQHLSSDPGPDS